MHSIELIEFYLGLTLSRRQVNRLQKYLNPLRRYRRFRKKVSIYHSLDDFLGVSCDEQCDDTSISIRTNHKQIRAEAEATYMATIAKRQKLFNDAVNRTKYTTGDLVGLKIDRVDRTNVTPKILPCKIVSIRSISNDVNMFQLCTTSCIISTWFNSVDLLNLTNCNFQPLRDVDPAGLPEMTFIQACKDYGKGVFGTPTEACQCNGNCSTKRCSCRAAKIQCSTKCHSTKTNPCSNL